MKDELGGPSDENLLDEEALARVRQLLHLAGVIKEVAGSFKNLDGYLFRKLCGKPYLSECEPEYCAFRYTDTCKYIDALSLIRRRYGVNVIERTTEEPPDGTACRS